MKTAILVFIAISIIETTFSQTIENIITTEKVVELVNGGIDPVVIASIIETSKCNFDMSTDKILELTANGIPSTIINAMVLASAKPENAMLRYDTNNPFTPHESGIYYYNQIVHNRKVMMKMDPSVYSFGQTSGYVMSAITKGVSKVKDKVNLEGKKAKVQVSDPTPIFYMYFDQQEISLSNSNNWFTGATSPNEFVLVKFTRSSDSRNVVVGSYNNFGSSAGVDKNAREKFEYKEVSKGVYEIYFKEPLSDGEYAFMFGGSMNTAPIQKVFDFGVVNNILPTSKFGGDRIDSATITVSNTTLFVGDTIQLNALGPEVTEYTYIYQPDNFALSLKQIQFKTNWSGNKYPILGFYLLEKSDKSTVIGALINSENLNGFVELEGALANKEIIIQKR